MKTQYTPYTKYLLMLNEIMQVRKDFESVTFAHEDDCFTVKFTNGSSHVCICSELNNLKGEY